MDIDPEKLEEALRRIVEVERGHLYGVKTGSATARRGEVERELNRMLHALISREEASG